VVRADSGFFEDELLSFLEERRLPYMVAARMTKWVKGAAQRVEYWQDLDAEVENRIAERKHDLGADGFCLQKFSATEAAFRAVLPVFNLLPSLCVFVSYVQRRTV
jgi:hypothetical protein